MSAKSGFKKIWHFLERLHLLAWIVTGIYTISTLSVLATFRGSLASVPWFGWLYFFISIAAVIVLLTLSSKQRKRVRVDRTMMIATGNRLIRGVKNELVMFGGDMSWAPDYRDSLHDIAQKGKRVTVIYPESAAEKVKLNAELLKNAGVTLWPLSTDLGLRAMLVDPSQIEDALIYLVDRSLKRSGIEVANGEPGTANDYEYLAQVYTSDDRLLMNTIIRLYKAASIIAEKKA